MSLRLSGLPVLIALLAACPLSAFAQDRFEWPEHPRNLQVLPKTMTGERLRPVMRGFSRALGVRCSFCHVGPADGPLSSYDFASDDNEHKRIARTMLGMLKVVNDSLATLPDDGEKVNMWCHTCHRGRPEPRTLPEELVMVYGKAGADSAITHYEEIREQFYGRGSYDFGEESLNTFGYHLLQKEDVAGALRVFQLNVGFFPDSPNAYDSLAEAYEAAGLGDKAVENYEKVLELDPRNRHASAALEKLKGGD